MTFMLCRNRVKDFDQWKPIFDSYAEAHQKSGLNLVNMWRSIEDPNIIFLMFKVARADKALEFINSPESAKAGEISGVIDGECHFIEKI